PQASPVSSRIPCREHRISLNVNARTRSERPRSAMKFVLASWGSRGDVEPNLAVGRELVRRGHDVCMAVPPDLVGFTEAAGATAGGFGPGAPAILDAQREFWTCFCSHPWRIRKLIRSRIDIAGPLLRGWQAMSTTLMSLA